MVKKITGKPVFFYIVVHKVKNPNWPEANHLNDYIYKQGHSQDFSKATHNFPFLPRPPQNPKSFQGITHNYDLRLFHQ